MSKKGTTVVITGTLSLILAGIHGRISVGISRGTLGGIPGQERIPGE